MTGDEREPRANEGRDAGLSVTLAGPQVDVRVTLPLGARRAAGEAGAAGDGVAAKGEAGAGRDGVGAAGEAGGDGVGAAGEADGVGAAGEAGAGRDGDTQLLAVGRAAVGRAVEVEGAADTELLAVGRAAVGRAVEDEGAADTELLAVGRAGRAGSADMELLAASRAAKAADAFVRGEVRRASRGEVRLTNETRVNGDVRFTSETRVGNGVRFTDEARTGGDGRLTDETRVRTDVGFGDEAATEGPVVAAGGRIGRFVVLRELGRGAMGVVYAAYDEELDRKVAIKLLHAGGGSGASRGRSMLLREAQAMARLAHPNVVAVHEVGVLEGAVFVAMEYVAGVDLQRWLAAERRPWREVLGVLQQAGAGLVAAHREGLVHRDFKPSNVLVGDDGRVRVADFGLATRRGEGGGTSAPRGSLAATFSGEGVLIGTPLYMAPELLRGGSATAASDQYAYAVALYEALYGVRPFDAETLPELMEVIARGLPATPPRAEVPGWLYTAVCRGLARAPEERWPSLAALVELLARDPEAERLLRRRRALQIAGAIAGTAVVVTLLVFAVVALRRYAAERQAEGRLAALREQMTALRGRGEVEEAARVLRTFVALPENRGTGAIAGAYLEWAGAQEDHAAAVDAYASAFIAARGPGDGAAALRGLIERLHARGQVKEAAAALVVLDRTAPEQAAAPELQGVRLAAALARRDIRAARVALASGDPGGWSPILADLGRVTEIPRDTLGVDFVGWENGEQQLMAVDHDGDGAQEVVLWASTGALRVFRKEPGLAPVRTIEIGGPAAWVHVVDPLAPGEPVIVASYRGDGSKKPEARVMVADPDGAVRVVDAWEDGLAIHATTVDFDGDGDRELYIASEAYARRFWRIERAADGAWSRRVAHRPTDAIGSDLQAVLAADLEGDGRPELVVLAGPWKAYDVRVYKPTAAGELDQVGRRAFGSFSRSTVARAGDRDVLVFTKTDYQIAPGRFPPDRPMGEPAGLYVVGYGADGVEILGLVAAAPVNGPQRRFGELFAGDLDGDGTQEIVVEVVNEGLGLMRWRAGEPLQLHVLAGLRPLLVSDFDGDGAAEVVASVPGEPGRVMLLGAGSGSLAPLPREEVAPRAVPPGIADPVVAEAWTRAEQLVAIGLPGRTATDLAGITGFAGQVAPDMLLRTGELFAQIGEDARAAEQFVAAAERPDLAPAALQGAARAKQRLGEFAAAEALTRQRLAVVGEDERAAVAAELAALVKASEPRPELRFGFARPLDLRWRVHDPVAARRGLGRQELAVWAAPAEVVAEFPLVWDGGPAALEVALTTGVVEWGTLVSVEVVDAGGKAWLTLDVGGWGLTDAPEVRMRLAESGLIRPWQVSGLEMRGRIAVTPGFDATIREVTTDGRVERVVGKIGDPALLPAPAAGPMRLRVRASVIEAGYVAHVGIREIRLTGFTAGEPDGAADEAARLLVEGDFAAAAAVLRDAPADSERMVWRIEALLGLGDVEGAGQAMATLLAAAPAGSPAYRALYQRLRRADPVAQLAARRAFGARLVDVLLVPGSQLGLRPGDVEEALVGLPDTTRTESPADPEALARLVLTESARGLAHEHGGQLTAARAAYAGAFARLAPERPFPGQERVRARLIERLQAVSVALGDREEALRWVRVRVAESETPYLLLERMQSDRALSALVGVETWATLLAEQRALRP